MKIILKGKRMFRNISFRGKLLMILFLGFFPAVIGLILFYRQLSDMVSFQNEYAMKQNFQQVYQSIDNQMNNMVEVATFLLADDAVHEVFQRKNSAVDIEESMRQYLLVEETRRIFVDSDSVDDIVFYLDSSFPMVGKSAGNSYRDISIISGQNWCSEMESGKRSSYWGSLNCDSDIRSERYISFLHTITDADDYSVINGVLSVNLEKSKLSTLMIPVFEEQMFFIQTDEEFLLGTNPEWEQRIPISGSEEMISLGDQEYYCFSKQFGDSGFLLVSCIPKEVLAEQTIESIYGFLIVLIGVVLVISVAYMSLAERLSRRIFQLAEACRKSENGELIKAKEDASLDEIGVLSRSYNSMIDRIEELLKEQFRIGEEIKDAQLKALQAQINPHFLYNTLEMISWMIAKEDKKSAQGIIRSLTRYYKSVLNKGKDEIELLDEIRMSEAYMEIQSCRFKGKIRFQCEVDPSIESFMVPKLILQPLLENAIFHGIGKKESGRGTIWLRVYQESRLVVIEVSDDGVGFRYERQAEAPALSESDNEKVHPGSKYGLNNIRQRVMLFFGTGADVRVESTPGIGTSVYILIPQGGKETE